MIFHIIKDAMVLENYHKECGFAIYANSMEKKVDLCVVCFVQKEEVVLENLMYQQSILN